MVSIRIASGGLMAMLTDDEKRQQWLEKLYQLKLATSAIQKALVVVLSTAQGPCSADEIREAVQRIRPETGRATVYRFIDKLTALGLLQRVHGYRNCNTYIPALVPHQALLICPQCGKVSELDAQLQGRVLAVVKAIDNDLEAHHITASHLQLLGTCITCQSDGS